MFLGFQNNFVRLEDGFVARLLGNMSTSVFAIFFSVFLVLKHYFLRVFRLLVRIGVLARKLTWLLFLLIIQDTIDQPALWGLLDLFYRAGFLGTFSSNLVGICDFMPAFLIPWVLCCTFLGSH